MILVFGASGYLGEYVYSLFKCKYRNVIGTYRTNKTKPDLIYFDINKNNVDDISVLEDEEPECAIICAAEAKYDACESKADESFQTNVTSTIKLINELNQKGFYIVFCSTESVYDGKKGNYTEEDQAIPVNKYGTMKLQIEKYIMENCPNACVFRLSKMIGVVGSSRDTLREWKKMAEEKKDIYCIRDNYFSPVDVEDVAKCIEAACKEKIQGIYNVCGNRPYKRADLCRDFLQTLGIETNVYEKDMAEFGFKAMRPLNVGMSNQKIVDVLKYKFKSMDTVYARYKD